jgi:SPP1 gp7 family putative phage head morphogenesis protein
MKQLDIYKQADKVAEYLTKQYVREFGKYRNIMSFDAANVIKKSKKLYEWLDKVTREAYIMLARMVYSAYADDDDDLPEVWLSGLLDDYDPVTKYVYTNEWERKRQRFAESVISSTDKPFDYGMALRLLTQQGSQYTITVADRAQFDAFKKNGIKKVMWDSENDTRVCHECHSRHRKVYAIDKVPPKPHYGCRCHLIPIVEENE